MQFLYYFFVPDKSGMGISVNRKHKSFLESLNSALFGICTPIKQCLFSKTSAFKLIGFVSPVLGIAGYRKSIRLINTLVPFFGPSSKPIIN